MRFATRGFGLSLVLMVLSACATSGRVDKTFTPNHGAKTFFVSERQSETEARYINQVVRTFEKHGYEIAQNKTRRRGLSHRAGPPPSWTTISGTPSHSDLVERDDQFVFSRTLKGVTWRNSHLLHELDPREVEGMKKQPGKDMMVFGSGSIVSQLTRHGLIDEYQFVVCPVLLGSGQPLLSGLSKGLRLDLVEAKKYKSGDVLLRYARQN